ncbi:MAG TPA: cytochrome b N-terminal domain-containing protein [Solirubrobacterales bacterium]|nr:cytochrome b N-terminal domain-containing protein [Solirubrobacterales bacterium]
MKLPFPSKKSKQADPAIDESATAEPKLSRSEKLAKHKELATHHGTEGAIDVAGWVDSRTNASGIYTALAARKVPKGTNWFYTLGSATMFIFAMQAITGVFLSMYYTPSATQAYASITHMTNEVFLGEFVRGLHKWGASLMIILIFLHMARTFFFGAYKYPRELNWVIGVVLLILTMVMGLTGYLLPFDQRSFWATIVANNITASGPVVGPYLADFLRAGPDFSATTLSRFYALHMMVVPGLIGALIGAHLFLVVKLGTTAPPWIRADRPKNAQRTEMVAAGMASADAEEVPVAAAGVAAEAPAETEAEAPADTEAPADAQTDTDTDSGEEASS